MFANQFTKIPILLSHSLFTFPRTENRSLPRKNAQRPSLEFGKCLINMFLLYFANCNSYNNKTQCGIFWCNFLSLGPQCLKLANVYFIQKWMKMFITLFWNGKFRCIWNLERWIWNYFFKVQGSCNHPCQDIEVQIHIDSPTHYIHGGHERHNCNEASTLLLNT